MWIYKQVQFKKKFIWGYNSDNIITITVIVIILEGPFHRSGTLHGVLPVISQHPQQPGEIGTIIIALWQMKKQEFIHLTFIQCSNWKVAVWDLR